MSKTKADSMQAAASAGTKVRKKSQTRRVVRKKKEEPLKIKISTSKISKKSKQVSSKVTKKTNVSGTTEKKQKDGSKNEPLKLKFSRVKVKQTNEKSPSRVKKSAKTSPVRGKVITPTGGMSEVLDDSVYRRDTDRDSDPDVYIVDTDYETTDDEWESEVDEPDPVLIRNTAVVQTPAVTCVELISSLASHSLDKTSTRLQKSKVRDQQRITVSNKYQQRNKKNCVNKVDKYKVKNHLNKNRASVVTSKSIRPKSISHSPVVVDHGEFICEICREKFLSAEHYRFHLHKHFDSYEQYTNFINKKHEKHSHTCLDRPRSNLCVISDKDNENLDSSQSSQESIENLDNSTRSQESNENLDTSQSSQECNENLDNSQSSQDDNENLDNSQSSQENNENLDNSHCSQENNTNLYNSESSQENIFDEIYDARDYSNHEIVVKEPVTQIPCVEEVVKRTKVNLPKEREIVSINSHSKKQTASVEMKKSLKVILRRTKLTEEASKCINMKGVQIQSPEQSKDEGIETDLSYERTPSENERISTEMETLPKPDTNKHMVIKKRLFRGEKRQGDLKRKTKMAKDKNDCDINGCVANTKKVNSDKTDTRDGKNTQFIQRETSSDDGSTIDKLEPHNIDRQESDAIDSDQHSAVKKNKLSIFDRHETNAIDSEKHGAIEKNKLSAVDGHKSGAIYRHKPDAVDRQKLSSLRKNVKLKINSVHKDSPSNTKISPHQIDNNILESEVSDSQVLTSTKLSTEASKQDVKENDYDSITKIPTESNISLEQGDTDSTEVIVEKGEYKIKIKCSKTNLDKGKCDVDYKSSAMKSDSVKNSQKESNSGNAVVNNDTCTKTSNKRKESAKSTHPKVKHKSKGKHSKVHVLYEQSNEVVHFSQKPKVVSVSPERLQQLRQQLKIAREARASSKGKIIDENGSVISTKTKSAIHKKLEDVFSDRNDGEITCDLSEPVTISGPTNHDTSSVTQDIRIPSGSTETIVQNNQSTGSDKVTNQCNNKGSRSKQTGIAYRFNTTIENDKVMTELIDLAEGKAPQYIGLETGSFQNDITMESLEDNNDDIMSEIMDLCVGKESLDQNSEHSHNVSVLNSLDHNDNLKQLNTSDIDNCSLSQELVSSVQTSAQDLSHVCDNQVTESVTVEQSDKYDNLLKPKRSPRTVKGKKKQHKRNKPTTQKGNDSPGLMTDSLNTSQKSTGTEENVEYSSKIQSDSVDSPYHQLNYGLDDLLNKQNLESHGFKVDSVNCNDTNEFHSQAKFTATPIDYVLDENSENILKYHGFKIPSLFDDAVTGECDELKNQPSVTVRSDVCEPYLLDNNTNHGNMSNNADIVNFVVKNDVNLSDALSSHWKQEKIGDNFTTTFQQGICKEQKIGDKGIDEPDSGRFFLANDDQYGNKAGLDNVLALPINYPVAEMFKEKVKDEMTEDDNSSKLMNNVKTHDTSKQLGHIHRCAMCGKWFKKPTELDKHIISEHTENNKCKKSKKQPTECTIKRKSTSVSLTLPSQEVTALPDVDKNIKSPSHSIVSVNLPDGSQYSQTDSLNLPDGSQYRQTDSVNLPDGSQYSQTDESTIHSHLSQTQDSLSYIGMVEQQQGETHLDIYHSILPCEDNITQERTVTEDLAANQKLAQSDSDKLCDVGGDREAGPIKKLEDAPVMCFLSSDKQGTNNLPTNKGKFSEIRKLLGSPHKNVLPNFTNNNKIDNIDYVSHENIQPVSDRAMTTSRLDTSVNSYIHHLDVNETQTQQTVCNSTSEHDMTDISHMSESDAYSDTSNLSGSDLKVVLTKVKNCNLIIDGTSFNFCGSAEKPLWKVKERKRPKIKKKSHSLKMETVLEESVAESISSVDTSSQSITEDSLGIKDSLDKRDKSIAIIDDSQIDRNNSNMSSKSQLGNSDGSKDRLNISKPIKIIDSQADQNIMNMRNKSEKSDSKNDQNIANMIRKPTIDNSLGDQNNADLSSKSIINKSKLDENRKNMSNKSTSNDSACDQNMLYMSGKSVLDVSNMSETLVTDDQHKGEFDTENQSGIHVNNTSTYPDSLVPVSKSGVLNDLEKFGNKSSQEKKSERTEALQLVNSSNKEKCGAKNLKQDGDSDTASEKRKDKPTKKKVSLEKGVTKTQESTITEFEKELLLAGKAKLKEKDKPRKRHRSEKSNKETTPRKNPEKEAEIKKAKRNNQSETKTTPKKITTKEAKRNKAKSNTSSEVETTPTKSAKKAEENKAKSESISNVKVLENHPQKHFMMSKTAQNIVKKHQEKRNLNSDDLPGFPKTAVNLQEFLLSVSQAQDEVNNNVELPKTITEKSIPDDALKTTAPEIESHKQLKKSLESLGIVKKTSSNWTDLMDKPFESIAGNSSQKRPFGSIDANPTVSPYRTADFDFDYSNSQSQGSFTAFINNSSWVSSYGNVDGQGSSFSPIDSPKTESTIKQGTHLSDASSDCGDISQSASIADTYGGQSFYHRNNSLSFTSTCDPWESFVQRQENPSKMSGKTQARESPVASTPLVFHKNSDQKEGMAELEISKISSIHEKSEPPAKRIRLKRYPTDEVDNRIVVTAITNSPRKVVMQTKQDNRNVPEKSRQCITNQTSTNSMFGQGVSKGQHQEVGDWHLLDEIAKETHDDNHTAPFEEGSQRDQKQKIGRNIDLNSIDKTMGNLVEQSEKFDNTKSEMNSDNELSDRSSEISDIDTASDKESEIGDTITDNEGNTTGEDRRNLDEESQHNDKQVMDNVQYADHKSEMDLGEECEKDLDNCQEGETNFERENELEKYILKEQNNSEKCQSDNEQSELESDSESLDGGNSVDRESSVDSNKDLDVETDKSGADNVEENADILSLYDSDMDIFDNEFDDDQDNSYPNSKESSPDIQTAESTKEKQNEQTHSKVVSRQSSSNDETNKKETDSGPPFTGRGRPRWMPYGFCFNFFNNRPCTKHLCDFSHHQPTPNVIAKSFREHLDRKDNEICLDILRSHPGVQEIPKQQIDVLYRRVCNNPESFWVLKFMKDREMPLQMVIDNYVRSFAKSGQTDYVFCVFEMAKELNIQLQKDVLCDLLEAFSTQDVFLEKLISIMIYSTEDDNFVVPQKFVKVAFNRAVNVPRLADQLLKWLVGNTQQLQQLSQDKDLMSQLSDMLKKKSVGKDLIEKLEGVLKVLSTNPGPANPGPANPGPSNPGPRNPRPTNPGPTNPGPSNPGPSQCCTSTGADQGLKESSSWTRDDEKYWIDNVQSVKFSKDFIHLSGLFEEKRRKTVPFTQEEWQLYVNVIYHDQLSVNCALDGFIKGVKDSLKKMKGREEEIIKQVLEIVFGVFDKCYTNGNAKMCLAILDTMGCHGLSPASLPMFVYKSVHVCLLANHTMFALVILKGANLDEMDYRIKFNLLHLLETLAIQLGNQNLLVDCLYVIKLAFKFIYIAQPNLSEREQRLERGKRENQIKLPGLCHCLIGKFLAQHALDHAITVFELIQQFGQTFPFDRDMHLQLILCLCETDHKYIAEAAFKKLCQMNEFPQQLYDMPRRITIPCITEPITAEVILIVEDYLMKLYNDLCQMVLSSQILDTSQLDLKICVPHSTQAMQILREIKTVLETKLTPPLSVEVSYGCLVINRNSLENYLKDLDKKGKCQGLKFVSRMCQRLGHRGQGRGYIQNKIKR